MATNPQVKDSRLIPSKAPNLPISPVEFSQQYLDTLLNAFRLYFNQIDNFSNSLSNDTGGKYLRFPGIAAQDSTTQYATATNTATQVLWNTLDFGSSFTLNADGTATPNQSGTYKIDYSLQFANSDTQIQEAYVWLRVNNTDVAGSASKFSVANKHGSSDGYLVAYSSVVFTLNAGDNVALWWATSLAATSGGAVGVYMESYPAQTSPFAMPSIPSAIGSITFVSGVE